MSNQKSDKPVPRNLHELADLYAERNAMYSDNYKTFGDMMIGLFPNGLTITSAEDWNRAALFIHICTKVSRYSASFDKGGHKDSLNDLSVYSQMLQELDGNIG